MKFSTAIVALFIAAFALSATANAVTAPALQTPSSLAIAQVKFTGDEFLVIYNNGSEDIEDLTKYRLESFNNVEPLASGVSSSTQQLPSLALPSGSSIMLSASPRATCGAAAAGKLSLSLTDGGGYLHLVHLQQNDAGRIEQETLDALSWSSGSKGQIPNVPSSTKNPQAMYYRHAVDDDYDWQLAEVDSSEACQISALVQSDGGNQKVAADTSLLSSDYQEAPSTIVSVAGPAATVGSAAPTQVPAANRGLMAPQVSELLPNPKGTGTDSTDEFIELYNPNSSSFDLRGHKLQTGTTSVRSYIIPSGTSMNPKSFMVFRSEATSLTLSNTGAQLRLVDPAGSVIASAEPYKNAKDGIAWASAKGKWYWTSTPTPGKANVVTDPSPKKKLTSKSKIANKSNTVKSAGTYASPAAKTSNYDSGLTVRPIHGAVVALVGVAAVLYGTYEYRHDLANKLHQLRAKLRIRR